MAGWNSPGCGKLLLTTHKVPVCGACPAKLDDRRRHLPGALSMRSIPVGAAGVGCRDPDGGPAAAPPAAEMAETPLRRRSLVGRVLGALGRIVRPGVGRGPGGTVAGELG